MTGAPLKRRNFLMLAGAAAAFPRIAYAQQAASPLVGLFNINTLLTATNIDPIKAGLSDAGFVVGQNLTLENYFADGHAERLPDLIAALIQRRPAVIIAGGGILPVETAEAATATIPIVFTSGVDPVTAGVVASLNRPGGNVTGVYIVGPELDSKRLEVLHELVPGARVIGVVVNPKGTAPNLNDLRNVAQNLGLSLIIGQAAVEADLAGMFMTFAQKSVQAILTMSDPVISGAALGPAIRALAAAGRLPIINENRGWPDAGAFASYGPNIPDAYRLAGDLAGRILKGEKPEDLPIMLPTKIELVINDKAAKELGITVPPDVIFRADDVIE